MSDTLVSTATVAVGDLVHPLSSTPHELTDFYREKVGVVVEVPSSTADGMPPFVGIKFTERFPEDDARRIGVAHTNQYVFTGWSNVTPKVGDRVRATCPQLAANPQWWEAAKGRTGVVTGITANVITMRFDTPLVTNIDGQREEWPSAGFATVAVIEQAGVSDTESNPVGLVVDTALNIEQRDRKARIAFDNLVVALMETAEEQDFCGQFEEWCEENGIESTRTRERTFTVYVDLTYEIDESTIASFLRREFGGDHDSVDASDVTVVSSVTISLTTTNGEEPNDVDLDDELDNNGYRGYSSYNITDSNED